MKNYAKKCKAEIMILDKPLDEYFHRPLLSQKLLIPSMSQKYHTVLFMDLDIVISEKAALIFDFLPQDEFFGVILDSREIEEFKMTWSHIPRIVEETTEKYFTDRNFKSSSLLQGSINGGVFIFRPAKIADVFKDYYFSDHNQGALNSFEETPFGYFSQINGWFEALPSKFNMQFYIK